MIEVVCHLRVVTMMEGENPFPAFLTPSFFHVLFVRHRWSIPFTVHTPCRPCHPRQHLTSRNYNKWLHQRHSFGTIFWGARTLLVSKRGRESKVCRISDGKLWKLLSCCGPQVTERPFSPSHFSLALYDIALSHHCVCSFHSDLIWIRNAEYVLQIQASTDVVLTSSRWKHYPLSFMFQVGARG